MNKKNIIIITSVSLILITGIILSKVFIFDPWQKRKKLNDQINLIMKYYNENDYVIARNLIEDIAVENADNPEVIKLLDKIILADKEKRKAENLEKQIRYEQYQNELLSVLKNILLESKKGRKISVNYIADKNYENKTQTKTTLKEKKSNNPDAEKLINEGIIAFNNKDYALAKTLLTNALKIDEGNAYAAAYLGAALFEENPEDDKNIEKSSILCNRAIQNNSSIIIAHFILAKVYIQKNITDEAIIELKNTIKLNPNHYKANYEMGKIYFNENKYDEAEIFFKNAIDIKPEFIKAHFYLGKIAGIYKNYNTAIAYYQKIIRLDPKFYKSYLNLARIYKIQNKFDLAVLHYEKANNISKNYKVYYEMGECNIELKYFDDAINNFNDCITYNPKSNDKEIQMDYNCYTQLIKIYEKTNKKKKVENIKNLIIEKYPNLKKENNGKISQNN